MITQINNIIDILWLLIGLISIIVLIAVFFPWGFLCDMILIIVAMILVAGQFWARESWKAIKKLFRKKSKWIHFDDHDLFI